MPIRNYRNYKIYCDNAIASDFVGCMAYLVGTAGFAFGSTTLFGIGLVLWQVASYIAYHEHNPIEIFIVVVYLIAYTAAGFAIILSGLMVLQWLFVAVDFIYTVVSAYHLILEIRYR